MARRPTAAAPAAPAALEAFNRGAAAYAAQDWDGAAQAFGEAVRIHPDWPPALSNLGAALRRVGRLDDAAAALEHAARLAPTDPAAQNNLGNLRLAQGRRDEGLDLFRRALAVDPAFVEAMDNLASALPAGEESLLWRQRRAAISRQEPRPWLSLADALTHHRRFDQALAAADQALALAPGSGDAQWSRALALDGLGQIDEALEALELAITADPSDRRRLQKAQTLTTAKRPHDALAIIDSLRSRPLQGVEAWEVDIAEARSAFLANAYSRAWGPYESRWKLAELKRPPFKMPSWAGEDLAGKRILLWSEQGAGDAIQFVRLAPRLKALGADVTLMTPPPLAAWLKDAPGVDRCVSAAGSSFDFETAMLSAARILDLQPGDGDGAPYLPAPQDRQPPDAVRFAEGLKVGIAWSGNPAHVNDRRRSAPAELFLPLARIPGVRLFNLQVDPVLGRALEPFATDLSSMISDWRDTAATVAALDVVVCVDTGTIHAAGALGVPTLVLLSQDCDWRWGGTDEDTPWYGNHRLVRQTRLGDWSGPFGRAGDILAQLARTAASSAAAPRSRD